MAFSLDKFHDGHAGGRDNLGPFARSLIATSRAVETLGRSARESADQWARAADAVGSIRPASSGVTAPAGGSASLDRLESRLSRPGQSLDFSPLASEFNRVGGTIIEISRRIDASMKFPKFDGFITRSRQKFFEFGKNGASALFRIEASLVRVGSFMMRINRPLGALYTGLGLSATSAFQFGAAFARTASAGLGVVTALGQGIYRVHNFMSSLGDVAGKTYSKLFRIATLGVFDRASRGAAAFGRNVNVVSGGVRTLNGIIRHLGFEVAAAFGVIGVAYKFGEFIKNGIVGAMHLNEVMSKTKYIFGDSAKEVSKLADQYAKDFGFVKSETLDVIANLGQLAKANGLTDSTAAKLSGTLMKLAADENSFNDVPFADSAMKFEAALRGQSEPISRFGILLNETIVKAQAMRMGLASANRELSEQAKFAARAAIIIKYVGDAQGDLARTADSAANQFRKAGGGLENFGVQIGEILLPAVSVAITAFNELLASIVQAMEESKAATESWGQSLARTMEKAAFGVRFFQTSMTVSQTLSAQFYANILGVWEALAENFGRITKWMGNNWWKLFTDMGQITMSFFSNLATNLTNFGKAFTDAISGKGNTFVWTPLLEGFKATADKLPDLVKPAWIEIGKGLEGVLDEFVAKELKRADALAKKAKPDMRRAIRPALPEAVSKPQIAGVAELGSREAVEAIARYRNGNRDQPLKSIDRTVREQLLEQRRTTTAVNKLNSVKLAIANL